MKKNIFKSLFANAHPAKIIALSFIGVIFVGTILLMLPISSKSGEFTALTDALFTATSATCVTGLVVFDTFTYWNFFGQMVILFLIQIGGLGLVTLVAFFSVLMGKKMGLKTLSLAQQSMNLTTLGGIRTTLTNIVGKVVLIEGIGAVLLAITFVPKYGLHGLWISVFLSISAFCNAGFDVLGFESEYISLSNYVTDPTVYMVIVGLIIIGGLGFIVWMDIMNYRKERRFSLHSKIVLFVTGALLLVGTILFLITEWNNPGTLGALTVEEKLGAAFFQSVTCRTAGFNTIDIAAMTGEGKLFSVILMFIGAGPGSTGGGIKIIPFAVLLCTVFSVSRGNNETYVLKHRINQTDVYRSLTVGFMGLAIVGAAALGIYFLNPHSEVINGMNALFEATSAFATVGLSSGVVAEINVITKLLLTVTMFIGRLGPVGFLISLAYKKDINAGGSILPEGKLIVG